MKIDVFNRKNIKVAEIDLPDEVFGVDWNEKLVHQALTAQLANRRQSLAHTKDRSEVRGGGKKPWRQKHTGRARVGSIRSPLWRGGGVTFGPRNEKKFNKKINKKMKRLALFSVLSRKFKDGEIKVIDDFNFLSKTKAVIEMINNFFKSRNSFLFISGQKGADIFRATRNIPKTKVLPADSLNIYDCLVYKYIFLEKEAVPIISNHYRLKSKK